MRKQFVKSMGEILEQNPNTSLILGDIGVFGFKNCFERFPKRVYNIGILEQSTVGLAAGLSIGGIIPFVHTIAPFLVERALEQLKVDFGYQELNGNFISVGSSYDYAGLGCTHHCPGDVQQLLTIPNMEIIVPGSSDEFDKLLKQGFNNGNPTYYRLSEYENTHKIDVEFGKANLIKRGQKATIICVGNMLDSTIQACSDIDVTILYYTSIYPFDTEILEHNYNETIIIIEPFYEGTINYLLTKFFNDKKTRFINFGVPHKFLRNYGTKKEHDLFLGLDSDSLKNKILSCL